MKVYSAHETRRMNSIDGWELASFYRRAAAFLLDIIFCSLLFVGLAYAFEPVMLKMGWIKDTDQLVFAINGNWYSLALLILYFGLAAYFGKGKTPGKWILGIRIISTVHDRLSLWHCIERALGYGYSTLEASFGFIQFFLYPNRRTLHDRIAETIVIRDKVTRKMEQENIEENDINVEVKG